MIKNRFGSAVITFGAVFSWSHCVSLRYRNLILQGRGYAEGHFLKISPGVDQEKTCVHISHLGGGLGLENIKIPLNSVSAKYFPPIPKKTHKR